MFRESKIIAQIKGEPRRRWFVDGEHDLIVWVDRDATPIGFQLIYPVVDGPRVFTCAPSGRLSHARINEGSTGALGYNMTAIIERDDRAPVELVLVDFLVRSRKLERPIVELVVMRMRAYGETG